MAVWRKTQVTNQLKNNLVMFVTSVLLDNGFYRNIRRAETDALNNDLSRFILDPSNSASPSGSVWKSTRSNWVYEGDTSVPTSGTAPIVPSGVWIADTFYAPNHSTYGHVFDYNQGKIIFASGAKPSSSTKIQVEFPYKECGVYLPNNREIHNLHNDYFSNDGVKDSSSEFPFNMLDIPVAHIEVSNHSNGPLALGGGHVTRKSFSIHLVASDMHQHEIADIADILTFKQDSSINLVDVDDIPERLNYRGSKAATYMDYKTMAADPDFFWALGHLQQMEAVTIATLRENYHRIRVDGLIEVRGTPTS